VPLSTGTRLGPYEILQPIGAGGMGEVYRARDTRLDRDVAIKVLPDDTASQPERLARFEREAKAVAALNHPNILALHDVGTDRGIAYAVTELLDGETLRARLERGVTARSAASRLSAQKALTYASHIARGLAAAHERGIVHRDLKPENLFITSDGRIKILDFGLAHHLDAEQSAGDSQATRFTTQQGVVVGTPGYMSPEQAVGQAATERSDLFAFGVVVHEMLTGVHPFLRETLADTATAIVREDAPPLRSVRPDLPAGVAGILDSCLEKYAADRPASARDIAIFLDAVGTNTTGSQMWGGTTSADTPARQRRTELIALGLLVLLTASVWTTVRVVGARAVADALEADFVRAQRITQRVNQDKLEALALTARLVASFPELRALFSTDPATIRDYLLSYQQRNPQVPLLIALGPDRSVVARTDDLAATGDPGDWIGALVDTPGQGAIVSMRDRWYHAAAAAADAGGYVFGYIIGAVPIDDQFAASLRQATQDEVMLLAATGVLASTLRGGQAPWRSYQEWQQGGSRDRATDVTVGDQRFAAREVALNERASVVAILLTSADAAFAPFRRIQNLVLLIGVLCVAIGAASTRWLVRR
jgi:hypothetical protein